LNTFRSTLHISWYSIDKIEVFCEIFFKECFSDNYNTLLSLFEREVALYHVNKNNKFHVFEAEKLLKSFLTIYEFVNRGMKGLLSGDITVNLITKSKDIFEKYLTELKNTEDEFVSLGLNPEDFYDSYFKINDTFITNNSSKKLTLNLSKHFENEGIHSGRLLYYVNLKHTQFLDTMQKKLYIKNNKKLNLEEINKILADKKLNTQLIFNDLYNEFVEVSIVNKLKTPFYGILHQEKENKDNLFRRQLMIEEGSFENANNSFAKIFMSLQE